MAATGVACGAKPNSPENVVTYDDVMTQPTRYHYENLNIIGVLHSTLYEDSIGNFSDDEATSFYLLDNNPATPIKTESIIVRTFGVEAHKCNNKKVIVSGIFKYHQDIIEEIVDVDMIVLADDSTTICYEKPL